MIEFFVLLVIFLMIIIMTYLIKQVSKLKDDKYFYMMRYLELRNGRKDDLLERMKKGFISTKYKQEILEGDKALKDYKEFMNKKDISPPK